MLNGFLDNPLRGRAPSQSSQKSNLHTPNSQPNELSKQQALSPRRSVTFSGQQEIGRFSPQTTTQTPDKTKELPSLPPAVSQTQNLLQEPEMPPHTTRSKSQATLATNAPKKSRLRRPPTSVPRRNHRQQQRRTSPISQQDECRRRQEKALRHGRPSRGPYSESENRTNIGGDISLCLEAIDLIILVGVNFLSGPNGRLIISCQNLKESRPYIKVDAEIGMGREVRRSLRRVKRTTRSVHSYDGTVWLDGVRNKRLVELLWYVSFIFEAGEADERRMMKNFIWFARSPPRSLGQLGRRLCRFGVKFDLWRLKVS